MTRTAMESRTWNCRGRVLDAWNYRLPLRQSYDGIPFESNEDVQSPKR